MKTLFAFGLMLMTAQTFAAPAYDCVFRGKFRTETVGGEIQLTVDGDPFEVVRSIAGQQHFYEFVLYTHEGRPYFQMLEGKVQNETYINTASFTLNLQHGQTSFGAASDLCGSDTTCWELSCTLVDPSQDS